MWLLSQYSSQQCGVYTYILAFAEYSSSSINNNRHRSIVSIFLSTIAPIPAAMQVYNTAGLVTGRLYYGIMI
jgi:hypothetical protein